MSKLDLSDFGDVAQPTTQPLQIDPRTVPNKQPKYTNFDYKLAIIGEAPGNDELQLGMPFVGMSGRLLNDLLRKATIVRDAIFVGNISQHRPPDNDIDLFSWDGEQIKSGLDHLEHDLKIANPNVCLLLGKTALFAAKRTEAIGDWRGSVFVSEVPGPFYGRKCIASYHPAACLREYSWTALLMMDIQKAKREALSKELILPSRALLINLPFVDLRGFLDTILSDKPKISVDIEGWWNNLTCLSIATDPELSYLVPFTKLDGTSYWQYEEEEVLIWELVVKIMADPLIKKIWQNGLYDRFALQYGYDVVILGNEDDTMPKFWEKYCELEKSLGFQCSVLTNEPYYKGDRKSDDRDTYYRYCCKDSALTYEINERLKLLLDHEQNQHYRFNHDLLNPLLYMELRGILYDTKLAKERLREVNHHVYSIQADLDQNVGLQVDWETDRQVSMQRIRDIMCYKRSPNQPKKDYAKAYHWCSRVLLGDGKLTKDQIGRLNTESGLSMNIKGKDFKTLLYETLKLPKQYTGDPPRLSTNYESLLKIQKKSPHAVVDTAIKLGMLRTRSQMLEIHPDADGRIRCGYNVVGTETGRLTCYTSPTGSGYNLQTIPQENNLYSVDHPLRPGMRDLFIADPGHYLFQCDLSGADGWTVGAYLNMLGDSTMLDDLKAKIKPASVVCYLYRHGNNSLQGKTRDEIKELLKEVKKEDWDYFACKQGIWGLCYTMGPDRLATVIATQSEGKYWLTRTQVEAFRNAVHARYQIRRWHQWMTTQLSKSASLTASNGFKRRFFGRHTEILGQALAHLPQVYTTYATNKAMHRLWTDEDNRLDKSPAGIQQLRVEPLHQVHDALVGQFKIEDTAWAITRIKSYFNNPITIANQTITIPFEGQYGLNWALDATSKLGNI
jgi:DNA polymerase